MQFLDNDLTVLRCLLYQVGATYDALFMEVTGI